MNDERYQGRGYGRKALKLVIQYLKDTSNANTLHTSCREGKGSPRDFYKKVGFKETGARATKNE